MARGFGATLGVGATDRITSALTTTSELRSYHLWTNRNGNGGGGYGRLFEQDGKYTFYDDFDGSGGAGAASYAFIANWTGAGLWRIARPSGSADHAIGLSYDAGAVTNDPVAYVDGVSVTVTQVGANPTGAAPSGTAAFRIGNAPASDRAWNGLQARFAIWNRILGAAEFEALGRGVPPETFPASLVESIEMKSAVTGLAGVPTIVGTAVQPDMAALFFHSRTWSQLAPIWAQ